jgi:hypothetical protein
LTSPQGMAACMWWFGGLLLGVAVPSIDTPACSRGGHVRTLGGAIGERTYTSLTHCAPLLTTFTR